MAHPLCKKLSNTWMTAIRTDKGTKRALCNNKTPTQANEKIKKKNITGSYTEVNLSFFPKHHGQ